MERLVSDASPLRTPGALIVKLILPSNVMRITPIFFRNISSISAQVNRFSCINPGPPNICNISNVPMVTGGIPAPALRLINPSRIFYDLFLLLRA
jgi:hypothetical protein